MSTNHYNTLNSAQPIYLYELWYTFNIYINIDIINNYYPDVIANSQTLGYFTKSTGTVV